MPEVKQNGGPAFPVSTRPLEYEHGYGHQDGASTWQFGGMTLRDYFAAQALQGLLAAPDTGFSFNELATACYKTADAMLKARDA